MIASQKVPKPYKWEYLNWYWVSRRRRMLWWPLFRTGQLVNSHIWGLSLWWRLLPLYL